MGVRKQFKAQSKRRFAVGAEVRVKLPGVNGIVTQLDTSPTVMGEYWHTVRTEHGERREPGSNLELIPVPATNAKPNELITAMIDRKLLSPENAIPLLRAQLQEAVETLRHDDPDVDGWERVTQTIVERTFGEHSKNANHFACRLSNARQSDEEAQAWHIGNIKSKKGMLRSFIKELEIIPPQQPQVQDDHFARLAVDEARKSAAEDERVHPMVGCVVVKDGRVLATAHRGEIGGNHAEFIALEKKLRDETLTGCTVYTTLEPCTTRSHPKIPCADRLIERKVARVVVGTLDPNPDIRGKGILKLRSANIITELFPHDLMAQIEELNREFIRKFGADSNAAQLPSQVVEPSQVLGRLTEKSRKAMIAALKPFAVSGRLIDIVKYANDSEVADLAYQLSAVLRDAGWKPTEYMRSSYEPLSGLLIEIDPKNPPTRAAADALLSALSAAGLIAAGPVLSLSNDIGLTVPPGAGAAIRLTIGAIVSR
jgi:pyrimidine deaminase RibD-like protein/heat shock protein HspQ